MMDLKYPEWQKHYEAALLESDPQRLTDLVAATETAIFFRLQALSTSLDGHEEREAITEAADALLTIKQEILKFPRLESV